MSNRTVTPVQQVAPGRPDRIKSTPGEDGQTQAPGVACASDASGPAWEWDAGNPANKRKPKPKKKRERR